MNALDLANTDLRQLAEQIGRDVAEPAADDVDREGRFPSEAMTAIKDSGLLGCLIPKDRGGLGATVAEVASTVEALSKYCASTAMILAMHQIQVACLVRHGGNDYLDGFTREVAEHGLLLASATTEIGVGGDVRNSLCAVEREGEDFSLSKMAPVISYGEEADAILVTARRDSDSPSSDQVLVVCRAAETKLEPISTWDALGFRGTCSSGFRLDSKGPLAAIIPTPYAEVSTETMLPVAHILWASVWLGIATGAITRARRFVQAEARSKPGILPASATRLAEVSVIHGQLRDSVIAGKKRFEELEDDRAELHAIGFAVDMNNLKVAASTLVVDVVGKAMSVCGISSYRQDSEYSLGRYLRDAYGAALMVNNDRIHANNAQLLLAYRDS